MICNIIYFSNDIMRCLTSLQIWIKAKVKDIKEMAIQIYVY
jgi:hypothetical protein